MNEGEYNGQIVDVVIIKNRFGKPGVELDFTVGIFDSNGQPAAKEDVYLEISNELGQGVFASKTQWEITKNTLVALGYKGGEDLSQLGTLVNTKCRIRVKNDSKGVPRYYFNTSRPKEVISVNEANAILKSILGGGSSAPAAAPFAFNNAATAPVAAAPAAAPSAPVNPFAGM